MLGLVNNSELEIAKIVHFSYFVIQHLGLKALQVNELKEEERKEVRKEEERKEERKEEERKKKETLLMICLIQFS